MRSLNSDKTASQDLSSGALSSTTTFSKNTRIDQIIFKASVSITETITITLDSKQGSDYDVVLKVMALVSSSSYVFRPEGELNLFAGDGIKLQCTNANLTGTIYAIIKSSEIGE